MFVTRISIVFLLLSNNIPFMDIITLLIHLSVYGHLGCFHFLATMNNATINILVQKKKKPSCDKKKKKKYTSEKGLLSVIYNKTHQ